MIAKLLPVMRRSWLKPVLLTQVFSLQQRGGYVRLRGSVRTETSGQPMRKEKKGKYIFCFFPLFAQCCMPTSWRVDRFSSRVQLVVISSCSALRLLYVRSASDVLTYPSLILAQADDDDGVRLE